MEEITVTRKDMLSDFYYVKKKNITMSHFKDINALKEADRIVFIDTDGTHQIIKKDI